MAVAAGLKEADYKSAETYLAELRQGHVELKFQLYPWLLLVHARCVRALRRGRGPTTRAPELTLEDMKKARKNKGGDCSEGVLRFGGAVDAQGSRAGGAEVLRPGDQGGQEIGHLVHQAAQGKKRTLGCCCTSRNCVFSQPGKGAPAFAAFEKVGR